MTKILIGADIGGSHITCMGVDHKGQVISGMFRVRRDIDSNAQAETILSGWSAALAELISLIGRDKLGGIGFAMPGPFDYPVGVAWFKGVQKFDSLYGVDVRSELVSRLGLTADVPVRFLNDATCFAVGEAWTGKASAYPRNMAITLGTGFGSSFIRDGVPVESGPDVPESGCVYHLPYRGSIADDHFSTRWFVAEYKRLTGLDISGVKELAEAAIAETATGQQPLFTNHCPPTTIFQDFGSRLGSFLAPWLIKFGAGCLTIGGNISQSYSLFEKPLLDSLAEAGCSIPVFVSEMGELAGISGAARLCDDSFYSRLPFVNAK
jgi:glucokinase